MKYLVTALTMFALYLVGLLFLPDNYLFILSIIALIILSRVEKAFVVKNKIKRNPKPTLLEPKFVNGNGNGHINGNGKSKNKKVVNFLKKYLNKKVA